MPWNRTLGQWRSLPIENTTRLVHSFHPTEVEGLRAPG
jgi:hypothetical protein